MIGDPPDSKPGAATPQTTADHARACGPMAIQPWQRWLLNLLCSKGRDRSVGASGSGETRCAEGRAHFVTAPARPLGTRKVQIYPKVVTVPSEAVKPEALLESAERIGVMTAELSAGMYFESAAIAPDAFARAVYGRSPLADSHGIFGVCPGVHYPPLPVAAAVQYQTATGITLGVVRGGRYRDSDNEIADEPGP